MILFNTNGDVQCSLIYSPLPYSFRRLFSIYQLFISNILFRSGGIWVLICTELMGRGIDFKGVSLVVNYDFPPSAVSIPSSNNI